VRFITPAVSGGMIYFCKELSVESTNQGTI
jgi:hypothetical protein